MDEAVLQLREIYKSEDTIPFNELQMNFVKITSEILRKSVELLKLEGRIKLEAENLTNKIKNNYETVKYVIGLIMGCFDLLENRLSNKFKNYFHPKKTPWQLYFPPKDRKEIRLWLKDYFNLPQYVNQYHSLSFLFEEWIFTHFREVRHFKAHKEIDTAQTILKNNLYKIEFDNLKKLIDFFKSAALIPFFSVMPEEQYGQLINKFLKVYFEQKKSDQLSVEMSRVFIRAEKI